MPKMYSNITDLYKEIREYKLIDLVPYVSRLDESLVNTLLDPPAGLYIPGSIEPLFETAIRYSLVDNEGRELKANITTDEILADVRKVKLLPPGNLANNERNFLCKRANYERVKRHLSTTPQIPIKGCEAAIATVVSYLNSLCEYTCVVAGRYELSKLLKPEFQYLVNTEEFERVFHPLYNEVVKFVGNDTWCNYHYRVRGTVLIIEKGLDFRIIEWHRTQIENSEGFDHDTGGVQEGYEVRFKKSRRR